MKQNSKSKLTKLIALSFVFIWTFTLLFPQTNGVVKAEEITSTPIKSELLEQGISSKKVDKLIRKMEKGQKLDSDIYMENLIKENGNSEIILATEEDPEFRKDFPDGSFIESKIEDITEEENPTTNENSGSEDVMLMASKIEQTGGTQEYRTLKISNTAPWGTMSFRVKVYFPLQGYAKIQQAYDWYYLGAVSGTEYKGIYRASETASQDAVAIYKLQIGLKGLGYLAKLEFRMRDGRMWTTYSS